MLLLILSYLAGALTILSPCILPVLPFVFARADQPFVKSGLPMLFGMALTFAGVATLAAVGGGWAVEAHQTGRWVALALLAAFGAALLVPSLSERLTRPLVALGGRLSEKADGAVIVSSVASSLLLGVATGLLWAPCAGPILGLILTGAALNGASVGTSLLLVAYAAGAATSLAAALLLGGRVFAMMKRSLGFGEWVRRGLGVAVLMGVLAIAAGLDVGFLSRISVDGVSALEQGLLDQLSPMSSFAAKTTPAAKTMPAESAMPTENAMLTERRALPVEGAAPSLDGAVAWLNSPPLSIESLRGKVVLVDFWTYSCINCLRSLPYVRAWAEKYKDAGLVVIGVHAPEFAFEKSLNNVAKAVRDLKIQYPVVVDNNYALWRGFDNHYWPAHYFIDAQGRIRFHHFGEGEYKHSEEVIRQLLAEAGKSVVLNSAVGVSADGIQAPSDFAAIHSPETYLGYARTENFQSPGGVLRDRRHVYGAPSLLRLNEWALAGEWTVENERAALGAPGGRIVFRFQARDLHLVLGPGEDGKPVQFRVRLDGTPPGRDHGVDINEEGVGTISGQRLYQLIRQSEPGRERRFEIEFLDPGAHAFAFTFG
ncbi:cytochrome c biogenesis protein CcmG, thiol:disulfide interchange protein DsbE [Azospirillaceae bacterium]